MQLLPCTLVGESVKLIPLSPEHHDQLTAAIRDPAVGRWMSSALSSSNDVRSFIEDALRAQSNGTALPFAIVDRLTDTVVGSTRFANVETAHRRVEIGFTFLAPDAQRTRINTESKYLLLRHAFEQLGCIRVEFKTDALNEISRRAILRLGAREEGTFRNHMIVAEGRIRDTVYFSIIDRDWPVIKAGLEDKLARNYTSAR